MLSLLRACAATCATQGPRRESPLTSNCRPAPALAALRKGVAKAGSAAAAAVAAVAAAKASRARTWGLPAAAAGSLPPLSLWRLRLWLAGHEHGGEEVEGEDGEDGHDDAQDGEGVADCGHYNIIYSIFYIMTMPRMAKALQTARIIISYILYFIL